MTLACVLAPACGARSGLDACAWERCAGGALSAVSGAAGARAGSSLGGSGGGPQNEAGKGIPREVSRPPRNVAGSGGAESVGGSPASAAGEAGAGGARQADPPIVLLLIDASYSMFLGDVWTPTFEALMAPDGPLERYQDRVQFGFASYRGPGGRAEEDPECAEITSVPFALENTAAVREAYGALRVRRSRPETPTGHALMRVTKDLLALAPDTPKHILLFSDGAPDTCLTTKPQCGQDRAIFAVQEAFRAGIETHAIGIGYGREYDCDPTQARCLEDHFQDIANAGRGFPVQAPPESYSTLPCAAETSGTLLAEYAEHGLFGPYFWAKRPGDVSDAVLSILKQILED